MTKKKLALEIIERLRTAYPDADCTLDYDHSEAWKLLVGVRLAAQCTDERVNIVVKDLYAKFPDVNALAEADPQEIEAILLPYGLQYFHSPNCLVCCHLKYLDCILTDQLSIQILTSQIPYLSTHVYLLFS